MTLRDQEVSPSSFAPDFYKQFLMGGIHEADDLLGSSSWLIFCLFAITLQGMPVI